MDQQVERADRRSAAVWWLAGAVGFLGGWVVHDELTTPAAALADAATVSPAASAPPAAPPAAPVVAPVVVHVAIPAAPVASETLASFAAPVATTASTDVAPQDRDGAGAPTALRPSPATTSAPSATTVTSWQVVVASDGSVVLVGDDGRLVASTGDASRGATVALDSDSSTIETGDSGTSAPARVPAGARAATGPQPGAAAAPGPNGGATAAVLEDAVADLEDHSVHVVGSGQIVTNDDSNAFVERDGQINSNTGDTDSSAVNALDVTDSRVRSGSSAGIPDEPGEDTLGAEAPAAAPAVLATPATDAAGAEIHDKSVHSTGTGNAVTQDDSSLVLGGSGHVNAQAGDSDTAGIVAMGVHGSVLESGCAGTSCEPPATP